MSKANKITMVASFAVAKVLGLAALVLLWSSTYDRAVTGQVDLTLRTLAGVCAALDGLIIFSLVFWCCHYMLAQRLESGKDIPIKTHRSLVGGV